MAHGPKKSPIMSSTEHKKGSGGAIVDDVKSSTTTSCNDAATSKIDATTTTALLTAIGLASRLASLDSRQYKEETSTCSTSLSSSSAAPNTNTTPEQEPPTSSQAPTRSTSIQSQLDELQSRWMLEDTSLPHLIESIHRLQSNAILLQREAATATEEVATLQTALAESNAKQKRLERIIRKLFDENERLRQKLTKRRKKRDEFVRNVREVMGGSCRKGHKGVTTTTATTTRDDRRNDAEENIAMSDPTPAIVDKLQSHEVILKRASSASSGSNRRQRALTADSALFSDLDESAQSTPFRSYNYDFDFSSARSSGVMNNVQADVHSDDDNNFGGDEESSVSSSSSAPSLVTERSMPTISLKPTASFPPSPAQIDATKLLGEEEEDEIEIPGNVYRLTIPTGRQIGIELQRVPLKPRKCDSNEEVGETAPPNNIRLDDASEHSFTLADAAAEVSSDIKAIGTLLSNVGKSALLSVTSDGVQGTKDEEYSLPDSAFLVCGFCQNFDSILNQRPPIGSRLIAIDDVSLETGEWSSFTTVKECILRKSGNPKSRTFTLIFRLDPLNEEQRSILSKAVAFAKRREDNNLMVTSHQISEEKEDFLLVSSTPEKEEENSGQPKATESMHAGSVKMQQKDPLPPAPGPDEVKLALKAFSMKMKAIL